MRLVRPLCRSRSAVQRAVSARLKAGLFLAFTQLRQALPQGGHAFVRVLFVASSDLTSNPDAVNVPWAWACFSPSRRRCWRRLSAGSQADQVVVGAGGVAAARKASPCPAAVVVAARPGVGRSLAVRCSASVRPLPGRSPVGFQALGLPLQRRPGSCSRRSCSANWCRRSLRDFERGVQVGERGRLVADRPLVHRGLLPQVTAARLILAGLTLLVLELRVPSRVNCCFRAAASASGPAALLVQRQFGRDVLEFQRVVVPLLRAPGQRGGVSAPRCVRGTLRLRRLKPHRLQLPVQFLLDVATGAAGSARPAPACAASRSSWR